MKSELIQTLTSTFRAHAQHTEGGVEYWLARDLRYLLGYAEWRNFGSTVVSNAKTTCEVSGQAVSDHFVDINKMVAPFRSPPRSYLRRARCVHELHTNYRIIRCNSRRTIK